MPGRPLLRRVCVYRVYVGNGVGQAKMSYAQDGNEATNENGSQGGLYIDDGGHADSGVGKEDKWSI